MSKELQQIAQMIEGVTGFAGYLAGGCVRDTLLGVTPKDYDYLVHLPNASEEDVFRHLETLSKLLSFEGFSSSLFLAYGQCEGNVPNNFLEKFLGGMNIKMFGKSVDLLITRAPTKDTVALFDCNLNMVYFDPVSETIVGQLPDKLEFAAWVDDQRKAYILGKWAKYLEEKV